MTLDALLAEIESLSLQLEGERAPARGRFSRLDRSVRALAQTLSRADLQRLATAVDDLEALAFSQRTETSEELAKLGGDRRAHRGYGCLRSSSQGQRISKKA